MKTIEAVNQMQLVFHKLKQLLLGSNPLLFQYLLMLCIKILLMAKVKAALMILLTLVYLSSTHVSNPHQKFPKNIKILHR
jgi:hypothetical protein